MEKASLMNLPLDLIQDILDEAVILLGPRDLARARVVNSTSHICPPHRR